MADYKGKKRLFYCDAVIEVEVVVNVVANDVNEAYARLNDGAWHSVDTKSFNKSSVKRIIFIKEGPGIS